MRAAGDVRFPAATVCLLLKRGVRFRNTATVKKELAFFLEKRVQQVKFVDRTFNSRHSHALEIWNFIREQDNGITNFHLRLPQIS